jgi:hypothetical protein
VVDVEELGLGYRTWQRIEDLNLAGRDEAVYELDAEAGELRFGDGVRGRVPEPEARIKVVTARAGGGQAGNLPPGQLSGLTARDLGRQPVTVALKVAQPLPTEGGEDAETLAQAERRIPRLFRDRDRAVTALDYRHRAAATPGLRLGRIEILPRFKPQQRREEVPGVVSVMVLPQAETGVPPNPRPDRPSIERVHAWLDQRRPIGTELYVIGCEYVPLGIGVGVSIRDGFAAGRSADDLEFADVPATSGNLGREGVLRAVREALYRFLWPLTPGGPEGDGWPLGRAVRDREVEVSVARVAGVDAVLGITLFAGEQNRWQAIAPAGARNTAELLLRSWQLPELLEVVVVADDLPPQDLRQPPNRFAVPSGIAIPVVPEIC